MLTVQISDTNLLAGTYEFGKYSVSQLQNPIWRSACCESILFSANTRGSKSGFTQLISVPAALDWNKVSKKFSPCLDRVCAVVFVSTLSPEATNRCLSLRAASPTPSSDLNRPII